MSEAAALGPPLHGLYISRLNLRELHLLGVAAKIRAQANAMRGLPSEVQVLFPSDGAIHCDERIVRQYGSGGLWRRLNYYLFFYLAVADLGVTPDFIYLRYQGASPALLWMVRRLRRQKPALVIFVEIPTYPYESAAVTLRARIIVVLDRMWRKQFFRHVDRVVTFSRDAEIFGVPAISTDNGVDVKAFEVLPAAPPGPMHMVGVANVSYWHGYDRVIRGLGRYYAAGGERDVRFDVVGAGSEIGRLKELARQEGIEDKVHFHGILRGRDLADILAQCHLGISCIALHRKKSDTTDLKSREYCARGLPFVIGYPDRDFPEGTRFAYQASGDERPLDIDALLAFRRDLEVECPDYRQAMRDYAVRQLDWTRKMEPVLAALREQLIARRTNRS